MIGGLNGIKNVYGTTPSEKNALRKIAEDYASEEEPKKVRKTRSNKGKKRKPYGPRTGVTRSKKRFRGLVNKPAKKSKKVNRNVANVANNANVQPNRVVKKTRKERSNKGKKRTPYGPRTGVTRSKKRFR